MGLKAKLLIPIILLIVGLSAALIYIVLSTAGDLMLAKQDEKAIILSRTISQLAISDILKQENQPPLNMKLSLAGLRDDPDMAYVVLFKGKGISERFFSGDFDPPESARKIPGVKWERGEDSKPIKQVSEDSPEIFEFLVPIVGPNYEVLGTAKIGISYERIIAQKNRTMITLIIIGLLVSLAGILLANYLARSITGPVKNLIEGIDALGRGEMDRRIDVSSEDEIGALAASFNQMTERLRVARSKMENYSRDLEEMVRARTAELRKAYDELKRLDELKDTFLSSVSHELRTPLTSISSFAEILLQYDDEDTSTREEFLGIIKREAERLSRLIDDVLDLAKIEAGMVSWKVDRHDLRKVVEDAIATIRPLAEAAQIDISFSYPPRIPQVLADRDRLSQVIMNLLSNARKFTKAGDTIEVRLKIESGFIHCEVEDHGIGISKENCSKVFEKFHQVDNEDDNLKDKPKGTGLGLPISRDIVEFHGGKLWVESEFGKGSTFIFTIPTADHPDPRPISKYAQETRI